MILLFMPIGRLPFLDLYLGLGPYLRLTIFKSLVNFFILLFYRFENVYSSTFFCLPTRLLLLLSLNGVDGISYYAASLSI